MLPDLVLHICCAPDEAYAVSVIKQEYNLFCFFSNSNISPDGEYLLRKKEAAKAADIYGIPFGADSFEPDSWETSIDNLESTPEGGERCRACFLLRLRRTAEFTRNKKWHSFGTVMSVSPHKNVSLLNECGMVAAKEFGVQYVPFDFKKKDGFRKSVILSNELGLYRQNYCGCRMSRNERDSRVAGRKNNSPVHLLAIKS